MAVVSYDELLRAVPIWMYAQNKSLVDEMPNIIRQAQEQLMLLLDHDLFQTIITGKTVSDLTPVIDLTANSPRIMEIRAVRLDYRREGTFTPLFRRNLEYLTMLYADAKPGRPLYWAEYGDINKVKVFPLPRESYTLEITANVQPLPLAPGTQTNKITTEFPRAMEKATLRQACLFMKNEKDAATYEKEMNGAVDEANAALGRRRRDDTGQRPIDPANAKGV